MQAVKNNSSMKNPLWSRISPAAIVITACPRFWHDIMLSSKRGVSITLEVIHYHKENFLYTTTRKSFLKRKLLKESTEKFRYNETTFILKIFQ